MGLRVYLLACFGFLFNGHAVFSPVLELCFRFKVARESCVFLVNSWHRWQDFIHPWQTE